MRWLRLVIACVATTAGAQEGPSPLSWSSDGQWLAYAQTIQAVPALPEGWLFKEPASREPGAPVPIRHQIWATRPATGESILLAESGEPLSAPCWKPDGAAIAYGRLVGGPTPAWEVVLQDDPKRRRVLYREPIQGPAPDPQMIREIAPAFSFDGRMLAISRPSGSGLLVVRVEEGTLARAIEGGTQPRWSPGDWRLAYLRDLPVAGLFVADLRQENPRRLGDLGGSPRADRLPPPVWGRDGQTIQIVRIARDGGDENSAVKLEVVRYISETGAAEITYDLIHDSITDRQTVQPWYTTDTDGGDIYYTAIRSRPADRFPSATMTWCFQRANEVRKRINPFDESHALGGLAARPVERGVAMRVRTDGTWSPPALCDPDTERLTLIAPDDASRADWRSRVARTLEGILLPFPDQSLPGSRSVDRPSLLPAPGEMEPGDLVAMRLRRLGRFGRSLGPPHNDDDGLAFAYFAEDHDAALAILQSLDERATTSGRRRKILAIRAQVLIAKKDYEGARPLIAFLQSRENPTFLVEESLSGTNVVPIRTPASLWPEFLEYKAQILKAITPVGEIPPREKILRDGLELLDNQGAAPGVLAAPILRLMAE